MLEEAGKFATEVIAPLNTVGDRQGVAFKDGAVTTPPGWKEAYRAWAAAGWNGLAAPGAMGRPGSAAGRQRRLPRNVEFGRHGLRHRAGADHGARSTRSPPTAAKTLQRTYLPKLVSGEWTGTMQLTEPQAGSDVGALRTKAERAGDGTYRLTGQKIFITYGEHDMTDNIVHLVLARLPDAPAGSRGVSLFLVPKFLRQRRRLARRSATTCARIRSSTRWASTARPPAPWCSATRAAPPAS